MTTDQFSPPESPIRQARPESEQIDRLVSRLQERYAVAPADIRLVKAPLRISPLGAHIDHQLGRVTGMTINQALFMAFAPSLDGAVQIDSLNFGPPISFRLEDVPPYRPGDWGNYIRGAVLALQADHHIDRGLVGVIGGDMPVGGLSSSAAVTIAYLLALEAVNELSVTPEANVALVRFTENQYIGLNNGILDQSTILFSERNHLTLIDCRAVEISKARTPSSADEVAVLAVYSGLTDSLVGTDYNNRVAECQEAAGLLLSFAGQPAPPDARLRHVSADMFAAEGHRLAPTLQRRAQHYFGEMRRVKDGIEAWRSGDIQRFGQLMSESGQSSIEKYECGSPQLISLYEILRRAPGVYGTRFSGAGFRGNCIALIDPAAAEAVAAAIQQDYPRAHPSQAETYSIHLCRPDGAARLVDWKG